MPKTWYNRSMENLATIQDLGDLKGKTVIVRADLDVALEDGKVVDNYRIKQAVKTIKHLVQAQSKIVVLGHLGRPENEYQDELSLMPVRFELGKQLDQHIKFAHIPQSRNSIRYMEPGEVLLLENIRFNSAETSENSAERSDFIKPIAELADYYINDAFATYRTPSASTIELAKEFKQPVAGLQMELEINSLEKLRHQPDAPYVAVIGGAKLSSKIPIFKSLVKVADVVLVGGAMAYTFLRAAGVNVGDSMVEADLVSEAASIIELAKKHKCELVLPIDHIAASEFSEKAKEQDVDTQQIPAGLMGMDIGERTLAVYLEFIKSAKTIMWNGPLGVSEWTQFSRGTEAIGEYIGLTAPAGTYKVVGGGDTIAAMTKLQINFKNFNHVSTGGGAMLAMLAGEKMPAIELLKK